jgi:hypothetical protein
VRDYANPAFVFHEQLRRLVLGSVVDDNDFAMSQTLVEKRI